MDFETIFPALPRFAGLRPYDHVPFQWSVHRLENADSAPQHDEFLADGASDPRREFIESLLRSVEGTRTIVVYNATFEKSRLKELATRFPEHDDAIQAIIARVWDLYPCICSYAYHPSFGGSYSLKSVLPAFIPELSYKNLEVGRGGDAVLAFEKLASGQLPQDEAKKIREALLEYCGQDTIALLRLYELLKADPRN
jgi:predicted RecB family nuclease